MNAAQATSTAKALEPPCQALTIHDRRCAKRVNYVVGSADGQKVLLLCHQHAREAGEREVRYVQETLDYRTYPQSLLEAIAGYWAEMLRLATQGEPFRLALRRLCEVDQALDALPVEGGNVG